MGAAGATDRRLRPVASRRAISRSRSWGEKKAGSLGRMSQHLLHWGSPYCDPALRQFAGDCNPEANCGGLQSAARACEAAEFHSQNALGELRKRTAEREPKRMED